MTHPRYEYHKKRRERDPEKEKRQRKAFKEANPDYARNQHLVSTYGLTLERYNTLVAMQAGVCAICGRVPKGSFSVDHDHRCCSGKKSCGTCVRGLLCKRCNTGIGMLGDDPRLLGRAIEYLARRLG